MSYNVIDPESWNRKEHFKHFSSYEEPFTGVTTVVDVSLSIQISKRDKISFFQMYLFASTKAVNLTNALKLRIVDNEIRNYNNIHASATMIREDRTFGFTYILYDPDFNTFGNNVQLEKKRIEQERSLFPPVNEPNVIHYSSMPWIHFTAISHARSYSNNDSVPKITFGKASQDVKGKWQMPISIHAHHGLVDGIDITEYLEKFQNYLNAF